MPLSSFWTQIDFSKYTRSKILPLLCSMTKSADPWYIDTKFWLSCPRNSHYTLLVKTGAETYCSKKFLFGMHHGAYQALLFEQISAYEKNPIDFIITHVDVRPPGCIGLSRSKFTKLKRPCSLYFSEQL